MSCRNYTFKYLLTLYRHSGLSPRASDLNNTINLTDNTKKLILYQLNGQAVRTIHNFAQIDFTSKCRCKTGTQSLTN